jgi:hypothetical protein
VVVPRAEEAGHVVATVVVYIVHVESHRISGQIFSTCPADVLINFHFICIGDS